MMIVKLRHRLRPPCGVEVRRLMALVLLGVALPRLPMWPGPSVVYPLHLLPQEAFGWLALAVGIGLMATAGRWRLRAVGRGMAILAFSLWITLAYATTSATSIFLDLAFAYAALGEIVAQNHEC